MRLPERLAAFRANFEAGGPPYHAPAWVHEPMHRATDELIASGAAARALKAGDRAPEFALKDATDKEIASWEQLAKGPLVVTFYRGVWCPYCNLDLQALQEALPAITERGAQLIAISPQSKHNSLKSERENKVTFPILFDPGNEPGSGGTAASAFSIKIQSRRLTGGHSVCWGELSDCRRWLPFQPAAI